MSSLEGYDPTLDALVVECDRLRAENARLREALTEAIALVLRWHSMGMPKSTAAKAERLYEESPEMRRLRAALAAKEKADG